MRIKKIRINMIKKMTMSEKEKGKELK